jgi:hypothetical protein
MSKYIYMAGLLDGEGTIGISTTRATDKYRSPYVSVTSTTPEIIAWLHENFGGHVRNQKVYKDHWKPSQVWQLKNIPQIMELLKNVVPHMLEPEKIRRANLLLTEYPAVTVRNGKYTDEQRERKLAFETSFLSR